MTARMFHCVLMCASCALTCMVCRGPVMAEMGESVGGDKKLIGWAAGVVQPAYLKQFIGELEAQFPLDGIVMTVDSDDFVRDRTGLGAIEFVYDDGRTWDLLKHLIYTGKGKWQFPSETCTVPEDAKGRIRFLLSINIPYITADDGSGS